MVGLLVNRFRIETQLLIKYEIKVNFFLLKKFVTFLQMESLATEFFAPLVYESV